MAPNDGSCKKEECTSTEKPKKRINKPLIEKRRRERINDCLNQLQSMVTHADKGKIKVGKQTKLEKADILEMTVEFVKRSRSDDQDSNVKSTSQFQAGFHRCVEEISTFCEQNSVPAELQTSIMRHINCKTSTIDTSSKNDDNTVLKCDTKRAKIETTLSQNVNIQPKLVTAITANSGTNAPVCITTPQFVSQSATTIVRAPTNIASSQPLTVVCNSEMPTYVLVPTAALCQSVQTVGAPSMGVGGLPLTVVNANTPSPAFGSYQINTNIGDVNNNVVQNNDTVLGTGQIMIIPRENLQLVGQPNCPQMTNTEQKNTGQVTSSITANPTCSSMNLPQLQANVKDASMWRPW